MSTDPPRALLALRGRHEGVRAWARRGLLPVWLVPDVAWTLVVPAALPASSPPYDDPVAMLGGRPVPSRLRPAVCLVVDGPRAVVTVQRSARRAATRWLVWMQGAGLQRVEGLPHAPVGLLAEVAGARREDRRQALRSALAVDERGGADVVDDLIRALGLPGAGVVIGALSAGELPGAVRVDPDPRQVERFDAHIAHEAELAHQLEDQR